MILATYQPLSEHRDDNRGMEWTELEKYLGFKPIFCFPANTQKEAIVHSILAVPSFPEKIVFFETDDYMEIDAVRWCKKIAIDYQNKQSENEEISIGSCFNNKRAEYKEYHC